MDSDSRQGTVTAVCRKAEPGVPKLPVDTVELVANTGVVGDYHSGPFVRHRSLARKTPTAPNHRNVLLVDTGIYRMLSDQGISLKAGQLGENVVVDGVDLMALPLGTQIEIGEALVELTEVRIPCAQLNEFHPGVLDAVSAKEGQDRPTAGMLANTVRGGKIKPGDRVNIVK